MAGDQDDTAEMPALREGAAPPVPGASSLVTVDLAALTDPGKLRTNNEDHYFAGRFQRSMRTLSTNVPRGAMPDTYDETVYAMLVADGVGGSAAGEIASRTAIQALVDLVLETPGLDHAPRRSARRRGPAADGAPIPAGPRHAGRDAPTPTRACAAWGRR